MTKFSPENNCATLSIAYLTGQTPAAVATALDKYHGDRGWVCGEGVNILAVGLALVDGMRWRARVPVDGKPFQIPSRAMVVFEGHAMAISRGCYFDTSDRGSYEAEEILMVFIPPEAGPTP